MADSARAAGKRRSGVRGPARAARSGVASPPKVSRHARPDGMTVEDWQRGLRRQFGAAQTFVLKNVGTERVFSDFLVTNPASRRTYRVAIRGEEPGVSYCDCPDFATNLLGTCKHVEFVLATLRRRRGAALPGPGSRGGSHARSRQGVPARGLAAAERAYHCSASVHSPSASARAAMSR